MKTLVALAFLLAGMFPAAFSQEKSLTREEVAAFLAAMADDVERWHLKSDSQSEQRGTLNEFVVRPLLRGDRLPETNQGQWGQWVQASLGDTYHSGAWYTAAMIQAWRATGEERYRNAVETQQLPLIIRMALESDTLFPEQIPTVRAGVELTIERPMKGYIPFWWDDGSSIYIANKGEKLNEKQPVVGKLDPNPENRRCGYPRKISQHLAQSLGVMFLEAYWMQPDNERLIEAIRLHQEFYEEVSPWGKMWTVAGVAGYVCENERWLRAANIHKSPRQAATNCRTYVRSPRDKKFQAPSFADGTLYRYYADLAKHGGRLSDENALFLINAGLNHSLITEAWSDTPKFQPGMERYDRGAGTWFIQNGKPIKYRSEQDRPLGSRVGPQHLSLTALALQALREKGKAWDKLPKKDFPGDIVVPIQQSKNAKPAWSRAWTPETGTRIELGACRHALRIRGISGKDTVELRVRRMPELNEEGRIPEGAFILSSDGRLSSTNDSDEPLAVSSKKIEAKEAGFGFEIDVPYTRTKGQNEWINGADHFRYEVSLGNKAQTFYLLTPSKDIGPWLEAFLVRGLLNWKIVFDEKGYIPGALNRPVKWGTADKRDVSHLYGYAFLTSACAQYLIYLD